MICVYYRLRFVTILLRIVAQSRAVQNAVKIYLPPGRHPVISAIAPGLASRFAHILTEPLPENLAALLQQLHAKLPAEPANLAASFDDDYASGREERMGEGQVDQVFFMLPSYGSSRATPVARRGQRRRR